MYISLQASNLIDQQIFKLGLNMNLTGVEVSVVDYTQSPHVPITDINVLKQYGEGHHLEVTGSLGNRLNLRIVKDTSREPNHDETFSCLLLESNRMKHIMFTEEVVCSEDPVIEKIHNLESWDEMFAFLDTTCSSIIEGTDFEKQCVLETQEELFSRHTDKVDEFKKEEEMGEAHGAFQHHLVKSNKDFIDKRLTSNLDPVLAAKEVPSVAIKADKEFFGDEQQLDQLLHQVLLNPSNCKPFPLPGDVVVEDSLSEPSDLDLLYKEMVTILLSRNSAQINNNDPILTDTGFKEALCNLQHDLISFMVDDLGDISEFPANTSVEMGVPFEDCNAPQERPDEFEDKYVPQERPVSPLMEAVLNRFKK